MRNNTFFALFVAWLLSGCNSIPGSGAAQDWFANYLSSHFQGRAQILEFSIVSSEETVLGGVPSYRISYAATVTLPNGNQPDCLVRLCIVAEGNPALLPASRVRYGGELVFQKATNSWVVAPDWTRPPRIIRTDLGNDLQCNQIAEVVRLAAQNEAGGRVQVPNITNLREASRSGTELRCVLQAEQNGGIGTFYARAYQDGANVRLAISRNQDSGASSGASNTGENSSYNGPSSGAAASSPDRQARELIEGATHPVADVPQEPSRTQWIQIQEGYEPLTRPALYIASPPVLNMYCSENRERERLSTSSHRCFGGWIRFSIPTAPDIPPGFRLNITYRLHKAE